MSRSLDSIAADLLRCALSWEREVRIVGNVTAAELAAVCVAFIDTCPACGSTAWANIDCDLCRLADAIGNGGGA